MAKGRITKIVTWVCDKTDCNLRNTREVEPDFVIFEDTCDYCHQDIHEPLTVNLAINYTKKKKNK